MLGKHFTNLLKKLLRKKETDPFLQELAEFKNLSQIIGVKNPTFKHELDMVTSAQHSTVIDGNLFYCAEEFFGVKFRHSFFNLDLVDFALSLSPEMKFKNKTIKHILRKATDGILPDKNRDRKRES